MKRLLSTTALLAALPMAAAHADLILTLNNINTAGYAAGPYATVDVHRISNTVAMVTFTALGQFTFGEMGLNVNSTNFSASGVTYTAAPGDNAQNLPTYAQNLNGHLDGFGNFRLDDVANPSGFTSSVVSATFDITNNAGTWLTDASVLTANNPQGEEAAIHVFDSLSQPIGNSAFAADGNGVTTHDVPEPASLALLGAGLLGLGFIRYRRV